jgi:hypothetical protein
MVGMSYGKAQFTENCTLINPPMKDPLNWNLNNGLIQMGNDLRKEMASLDRKLDQVMAALQQIHQAQRR